MSNQTKNITDRIMIVRLGIHQWYPKKHDKKATKGLADLHHVDPERLGKVIKNLVDLESIRPLQQACRKLREEVHSMTAPWEDGGLRALPAELYYTFCNEVRDRIQEIDRLADDYQNEYESEREKARLELKGLFNEDDYPAPHVMRARFSVDYDFKPVANVSDIRVWGLAAADQKEIEEQVTASVTAQVQQAQAHVFNQVVERAQEFIDKVTKFDDAAAASQNDGKGLRLYDSAISNLRDVILLVLEGMNFTGDQEIETLCKELKKSLKGVNTGKLKVSPDVRKKSIADVEKVLNKFSGAYGS
jgi:hypothetical protein